MDRQSSDGKDLAVFDEPFAGEWGTYLNSCLCLDITIGDGENNLLAYKLHAAGPTLLAISHCTAR